MLDSWLGNARRLGRTSPRSAVIDLYTFLAPTTANRVEAAAVAVMSVAAIFLSIFRIRCREPINKLCERRYCAGECNGNAMTMEGVKVEWNEKIRIQGKK